MQYILPAFFAFTLTVLLTYLALRFFPKWGLLDRPWKYGLKRKPIPYYGGVVIFFVFMLSVLIFVKLDSHLVFLLLGATLITLMSFLDDLFGLSPYLRFCLQIVAAFILVIGGIGIHSLSNPLGDTLSLDQGKITFIMGDIVFSFFLLSAMFTIIWVVGMVNTMNWLDGLNGLPSGVTAIAALTLFFLSIRPDIHLDPISQVPVALMSIIIFACALGFWFFDFYPAKILMGDTGSMFLGFVIATLAIFSGGKIATAFLVLGFPILDAAWVILRRILEKKSPFKGDRRHLHHRLLEAGLSERQTILLIYSLCAIFGTIALFLQGTQKILALLFLFLTMIVIGISVVYCKKQQK